VPFIAALALVGLVGLVALYGLYHRAEMNGAFFQRQAGKDQEPASADDVLSVPRSSVPAHPVVYRPPALSRAKPAASKPAQEKPAAPDDHGLADYVKDAWKDYFKERLALDQHRVQLRLAALSAKSAVPGFDAAAAAAPAPARNGAGLGIGGLLGTPGFAASGMLGYGGFPGPGGMPGDTANQTEKQHFMAQAGDTGQHDVLQATRRPPPSPYAVMAGDLIPAAWETAGNSDTPGKFTGRVTHDVYNTKDGTCIIIPVGSKLIGKYDSNVGMGQERLPGVLTRIIYPDTSNVDLGAMEMADQTGAAGADADVNNHVGKRLINGLIVGIFGLGNAVGQLMPFGTTAFIGGPASAISSIGELGLHIPPTLTVASGTPFNVVLGQDLDLRPWSCNGRTPDPQLPIMRVGG